MAHFTAEECICERGRKIHHVIFDCHTTWSMTMEKLWRGIVVKSGDNVEKRHHERDITYKNESP